MAINVMKGFAAHIMHEGSFIGGEVIDVAGNIVVFKSYDEETAFVFTQVTFAIAVGRGVIFGWNTDQRFGRKNDNETTAEKTA